MKLIENSKWHKELNKRDDGRIEWLCPDRGIGHTILIPKKVPKEKGVPMKHTISAWYAHGCDGCCTKYKKHIKEIVKDLES